MAELAGLHRGNLKRAKSYRQISTKGFGNAIVPEVAAEFIMAAMSLLGVESDCR